MNTRKLLAIISIAVLYSIAIGTDSYAQHELPDLKSSIEIEDIKVIGEAKQGDTFDILVRYKALLDSPGNLSLRVPAHAELVQRGGGVRSLRETRSYKAGEVRTERFTIKANEVGYGFVLYKF